MKKEKNKKSAIYIEDSSTIPENPENFKGNNYEDENETRYFEFGAHFQIDDLRRRLTKILNSLSPKANESNLKGYNLSQKGSKEKFVQHEIISLDKTKDNTRKQASGSKVTLNSDKKDRFSNHKSDSRNTQISGKILVNSIVKTNRDLNNTSKGKNLKDSFIKNVLNTCKNQETRKIIKNSVFINKEYKKIQPFSENKSNFKKIPLQSKESNNVAYLGRIKQTKVNYNFVKFDKIQNSQELKKNNVSRKTNSISKKIESNSFVLRSTFNVNQNRNISPFIQKVSGKSKLINNSNITVEDLSKNIQCNLSLVLGNICNKSRNVNHNNEKFTANKSTLREKNKVKSVEIANVSNITSMKKSMIKNEKKSKIRNVKNSSYQTKNTIYKSNLITPDTKLKKSIFTNEVQLKTSMKQKDSSIEKKSIIRVGGNPKKITESKRNAQNKKESIPENSSLIKENTRKSGVNNSCLIPNQEQEKNMKLKTGIFLKMTHKTNNYNQPNFVRTAINNK